MRLRSFAFVLVPAAFFLMLGLPGCGGEGGCSGYGYQPSGDYAGAYTATFRPDAGASGALTFAIQVASDGSVTGTVTDPAPEPDAQANVGGSAVEVVGCAPQAPGAGLRLTFTLAGELNEMTMTRSGNGTIAGTLRGARQTPSTLVTGKLLVSRTP